MKKISDTLEMNIQFILFSLSVGISVFSFLYYLDQNLITAYGDSRVHLNIARRVVDSLTPGIGQMIGSWLPLLHILMLPTIWVDKLWISGISGSLPNMIAYIACCLYFYKLVVNITGKKINGICAFLIVALNINIIYFQATPMTEILFIATLVVSLYYLALWIDNNNTLDLLKASFFMVLTSLNRYEGWFVVAGSVVLITIYSFIKHGGRKAEGVFFVYGTLAVSGIMLWLILHLLIFGNPLEFLHNEFAAGTHTAKDIQNGLVPTYKNLYLASLTQVLTMNHILGILLTTMFFPLIIYYSLRRKFYIADKLLLLFTIAFIPFLFEILVLYQGKVPTYVPEIRIEKFIPQFFNVRYAIYSLPAFALILSSAVRNQKAMFIIMCLILLNNFVISPMYAKKITALQDASLVSDQEKFYEKIIPNNINSELILISAASSESIMMYSKKPLRNFITESTNIYWKQAIEYPQEHATYIILNNLSNKDSLIRLLDMGKIEKYYFIKTEVRDQSKWLYRLYKRKGGNDRSVKTEVCTTNFEKNILVCKAENK